MRGVGPQGAERGDQEQWIFPPRVRLRPEEKKLVIATVIKLATYAMFAHHYYGFAGEKYHQGEGGPIGLRGTCTIARLTMQAFDEKWLKRVTEAGLEVKLYLRYMDDGRKFLHPVKPSWRWMGEELKYSRRWEIEDRAEGLSQVQLTVRILKESMKNIATYLKFTYETGEEYEDGWLSTLDKSTRITRSYINTLRSLKQQIPPSGRPQQCQKMQRCSVFLTIWSGGC